MEPTQIIVTVFCSVLASSGLWAFIQKISDKKDARTDLLIGIAHDRIIFLGLQYIARGWITEDELDNLIRYLYDPYRALGGNGTAEKVVNDCKKLPIKQIDVSTVYVSN